LDSRYGVTGDLSVSEFDKFAAELKAAHAARQREHEEQLKQEDLARREVWGKAQDYLEVEVMPILKEAKTAFERNGFRTELRPNWEKDRCSVRPEICFQVFGQKKSRSDTSTHEVSGDLGKVWHDGTNLNATVSSGTRYRSTTFEGMDLDAVREVAKRALASLCSALDPSKP
jgi:hypothetical protein